MASELDRKAAELEGAREERCGGGTGWEGTRRGVAGAKVSPWLLKLSPMSVASLLDSTRLPHAEQYRLASETSVAQEGQRIERGLYHHRRECLSRRLFRGLAHGRGFRQGLIGFAAMGKSRGSVNGDGQQSHGFNAEEDAEGLESSTKETTENVGAERRGGVTCLLKRFCEDQAREEHGQGGDGASDQSARDWG